MAKAADPVHILQVVGVMDRGGAETWLMHVLRHIDRSNYRIDFLVHQARPGAYDAEIRDLGSKVIACPYTHSPAKYGRCLAQVLKESGPYDVVHSHVHYYSGFVLRTAARAGVPLRVSHSHSDTSRGQVSAGLARRFYWRLMRRWLDEYESFGLAASALAAVALWGPRWDQSSRRRILRCGIDLQPFRAERNPEAVRREIGLAPDIPVLGHVGRFDTPKNQSFLLEVVECAQGRGTPLQLLLIGDGETRPALERYAREAGLGDRIVFAGARSDVPRLLMNAVDVFALPSHWEGLPVSALEAQAAGIPTLISENVTREVDVAPGLVRFLSLDLGPAAWLDAVVSALTGRLANGRMALEILERSPFNITENLADLSAIYRSRP